MLFFLLLCFLVSSEGQCNTCECTLLENQVCPSNCLSCLVGNTTCLCWTSCSSCSTCSSGYTTVDSSNCSTTPQVSVQCRRQGSYQTSNCASCKAGTFGSNCSPCPSVNGSVCNSASSTINKCNDGYNGNGLCVCNTPDYDGPSCQYSRLLTCSNHGNTTYNGGCNCDRGWDPATNCSTCAAGYTGTGCTLCSPFYRRMADGSCARCTDSGASPGCNSKGTCNSDGTCTCLPNYIGDNCDKCNKAGNYYDPYPSCTYCYAPVTCNGQGTCNSQGVCSCNSLHSGPNCDICPYGYAGVDCTPCPGDASNPCGALSNPPRGNCSMGFTGTGLCNCTSDGFGLDCMDPMVQTMSPTNGPTGGYTTITMTGSNFGTFGTIRQSVDAVNVSVSDRGLSTRSWQDDKVLANNNAGVGVVYFTMWKSNNRPSPAFKFTYDPPTLEQVSTPRPTTGAKITIFGSSFGFWSDGDILFNGAPFPNSSITEWRHGRVVLDLPPGIGTEQNFTIRTPSGQGSILFRYDAPTVKTVTPVNIPTVGGDLITITGTNFGTPPFDPPQVIVYNSECVVTNWTHTNLTCISPPTRGTLSVRVVVAEQSATLSSQWKTRVPTVLSVSGCTPDPDCENCTQLCVAAGSANNITITGTDFGPNFDSPSKVYIGASSACTKVVMTVPHTEIVCQIPKAPTTAPAYNLPVCVQRDSMTGCKNALSYAAPWILNNTLRIYNEPLMTTPDGNTSEIVLNSTNATVYVQFNGSYLTKPGGTGTGTLVYLGPSSLPTQYQCTVRNISDNGVVCQVGPGVGGPLRFSVRSASIPSNPSPDAFYFPAPVLDPLSIGTANFYATTKGQNELISNTTQGELIIFTGRNFGTDGKLVSVYYGPASDPLKYSCINPSVTGTQITCLTVPGAGSQLNLTVQVGHGTGAQSTTGVLQYTYSQPPIVYSISGCVEDPTNPNRTIDCPTDGRWPDGSEVVLTIVGAWFGLSGAIVTIGGDQCIRTYHSQVTPRELVYCVLPPGAGREPPVVVRRIQAFSQDVPYLDYASPQLLRVSGCEDHGNNTENCYREGGQNITIYGTNFGVRNARVKVGGIDCENVTHDVINPNGVVTCITPPGIQLFRAVYLLQDLGEFSAASVYISYQQCPAGTFSLYGSSIECYYCTPGYFADKDGQDACLPCPPGTATNETGAVSCEPCEPGLYTPTLNHTECLPCLPGTASLSPGSIACVDCSPGTYADSGEQPECFQCDIGAYQPAGGQDSCIPCPEGTANSLPGQQACVKCDPGYYNNGTGAERCQICPAGQYAMSSGSLGCLDCLQGFYADKRGQGACLECPKGYFSNETAATTCLPCPAGSFQDLSGQSQCTYCPSGSVSSSTGNIVCTLCAVGYYSSGDRTSCLPCPAGTYQSAPGQANCTACPSGSFSGSSASIQCVLCPIGLYTDESNQQGCKICPSGTYSDLGNQPGSTSCVQCAVGRYSDQAGVGNCVDCLPGRFANSTFSTTCMRCSPGTYTGAVVGSASCLPCAGGSFASQSGAIVCDICPKGLYSSQPSGASSCLECEAGSYQDLLGQPNCKKCTPGYYSSVPASVQCSSCPGGRYGNASSLTACELCSPGYYSIYREAFPPPQLCIPCEVGRYAPQEGFSDQCLACDPGRYQNETAQTECVQCDVGTYQDEILATSCFPCTAGKVQSLKGQKSCDDCGVGRYQPDMAQTECMDCAPGKYGTSLGSSACSDCLEGRYNPRPGQERCLYCDVGRYSAVKGRDTECEKCETGSVQPRVGASTCFSCPAGTIASEKGLEECKPCAVGEFQNSSAQSACFDCPAGTFQGQPGQTSCNLCDIGEYSPVPKSQACSVCPAGSFNIATGLSGCEKCPAGRFQPQPRLSFCINCSPGFFSSVGASAEEPCEAGSIAPGYGSRNCTPCGTHASPNPAQTKCLCDISYYDHLEGANGSAPNGVVECMKCPKGTLCEDFGVTLASLQTKPGWWRPAANYDYYQCLLPSHCLGGVNSSCGPNREGPLCALCEPGYRSTTVYSACSKCPTKAASTGVSVVVILVIICALLFMYYIVIRSSKTLLRKQAHRDQQLVWKAFDVNNYNAENSVSKLSRFNNSLKAIIGGNNPIVGGELTTERRTRANFLYKMKIIVGFLQICSNLSFIVLVPWPSAYASFLRNISFVNLDFVPWQSVGCVSQFDFYTKYLVVCLTPIGILLGLLLFFLLPMYWVDKSDMSDAVEKRRARKRIRRMFWKLLLFTLFLLYPNVSSIVFSPFQCKKIEGQYRLVSDFSIVCGSEKWMRYLPINIIMVFVYPIGIPAFCIRLLLRYKGRLSEPGVRLQLGFLYEAYHKDMWFFEMCDVAHKLFLTSLVGFFPTAGQLPVAMVVVALYTQLIWMTQPYIRTGDERLHLVAQTELYMIICCGYILSFTEGELDPATDIALSIVLIGLTIGLILFFIILASINIRKLLHIYQNKKREKETSGAIGLSSQNSSGGSLGSGGGTGVESGGSTASNPAATSHNSFRSPSIDEDDLTPGEKQSKD